MLSYQPKVIMKKLILILVIILIGLSTILLSYFRMSQERLVGQGYRVDFTKYSIAIFKDNTGEQVLRISPQDDYYYQGSLKDHIINKSEFQRKHNYLAESVLLVQKLFGGKTYQWSAEGDNQIWHAVVSYDFSMTSDGVVIKRTLPKLPKTVYAIGQAVIFCDTCIVTDNLKRIYYNGDSVSTQDLSIGKKLVLTPFVLDRHQSIVGITKLHILDAQGKPLVTLPVYSDQEVYFDQKYHLVELKAIIPAKRTEIMTQTLQLN